MSVWAERRQQHTIKLLLNLLKITCIDLYRTISTLRSSLYRIQEVSWWGFGADRYRFANKKTRFTLVPEVRHRAATTELCRLKLLPGISKCEITREETFKLEEYKIKGSYSFSKVKFKWFFEHFQGTLTKKLLSSHLTSYYKCNSEK